MIKTIPLNKLVPSPRNVRRTGDDQADFELKADIEARGLLQNLVVTGAAKPKGSFAVEAGGRRLRALQCLAEEGKIEETHEICCLVIQGGPAEASEASLAENFQRLAMNPADECLAFQQLIEQGLDVEGVARRFGLTIRFVEGRLRLAGLAPVIFEALGAGEISLDIAKAYAATADQQRQALVFEQMGKGYGYAHPDTIRRMVTQTSAGATDPRARLVGEDTYVAAGGRIERDLFDDDAATRWLDIPLLERLAAEKMEALAETAAAETGLAWVRPTMAPWVGYEETQGLRRVSIPSPALTDEESAAVEALEAEIGEQVALLEDEELGDEAREATEAKVRELDDRIDAIVHKPPVLTDELKAELGAFLVLDQQGRPRMDTAYYSENWPEQRAAPASEAGEPSGHPAPNSGRPVGLSQRLVDELAMQRRDILAVHLAANPALALDLATFLMINREAGYCYDRSGSSLIATPPSNPAFDFKTPEAAATIAATRAADALDRSWTLGETLAERFAAFRTLSKKHRGAWLGHAVARTLEASLNLAGSRDCPFHDHLGQLLSIDVARWWRPTAANFFDRVPKSMALAALAEVGGPEFASRYSGSKKAELAESCERIFAGNFIGEAEVKQAALAWVPGAMRFAIPPAEDPEAAEAEDVAANRDEADDGAGIAAADMGGDADRAGEADGTEPPEVEIEEAA